MSNVVRISQLEAFNCRHQIYTRCLLKEKGLPLKGTVFPSMRADYTYTRWHDPATGDICFKAAPKGSSE